MQVGIINGTSYFGLELIRLLSSHPEARITAITARSQADKRLVEVSPHIAALPCGSQLGRMRLTEAIEVSSAFAYSVCGTRHSGR